MMKKIKIAIVGCGWFGNFHLDYLKTLENVEIVALVSTNPHKLVKTGEKVPQAKHFSHYSLLFQSNLKIDAIILCVPPHQHEDLEIETAKRGIHLFIEKPIELSIQKAKTNLTAFQKAGIIVSVGYHERYNNSVIKLKKHLVNHPPTLAQARWIGDIPGAAWWRKQECSGGQVVEQSTHLVDLLRYLFGEVRSIYAQGIKNAYDFERTLPDYSIEDATSALLTFENGTIAHLMTGCYVGATSPSRGIMLEILNQEQKITYDWMDKVTYESPENASAIDKEQAFSNSSTEDSHHTAIKTFIACIVSGNSSAIRSSYADALKTLEVTLKINESVASGQVISL
jgi:predicted dehydrogenase